MIVAARLRLSLPCTWFLVACWAVLMALQTVYLRRITLHIPTLELSLFVWRLMLPTAFVAFAALVSRWEDVPPLHSRVLAVLTGISVAFLAGFTVLEAPNYLPHLVEAKDDRGALVAYDIDKDAAIWGIREYLPNYSTLPRGLLPARRPNDVRTARFAELSSTTRPARPADKPYLLDRPRPGNRHGRLPGRRPAGQTVGLRRDPRVRPARAGCQGHRRTSCTRPAQLIVRGVMLAALACFMGYALFRMRRPFAAADRHC